MDVAKLLMSYRKMYHITQEELSIALGVDRSTYTCYENGKSVPLPTTVRLICAIMGIPTSAFEDLAKDHPDDYKPGVPHYSTMLNDSICDVNLPDDWLEQIKNDPDLSRGIDNKLYENTENFQVLSREEQTLVVQYRLMKVLELRQEYNAGDLVVLSMLTKHIEDNIRKEKAEKEKGNKHE